MSISHEAAALLKKVMKPGRYIGGEMNSASKDLSQVDLRTAFCFPDLYEIGMSYTGLQILYGIFNSLEGVFCERAFAPADDMEALMRENDLPLFTLETHSPVADMDLVCFTLQYELSYTNVLNMLSLAGIPMRTSERTESDAIVCAGGSCACNPEPIAEVFDFIVVGDGEEILPEICAAILAWKKTDDPKSKLLERLARMDGIYVPSFYEPIYADGKFTSYKKKYDWLKDRIKRNSVADLDAAWYPLAPLVPVVEAVHERAVCEISRGCGRACRFCQAGYIYRPVRERSETRINEILDQQLANTGYDEVSLLSLSAGDHASIESLVPNLMDKLKKMDVSLSLPSLRLDSLSEDVIARIAAYKKSSLTFAPEAGTQRLRDVVRKNITEENIFAGIEKAIGIGWNRVKLYFMIGLPTETMEDIEGIAVLAENILRRARAMQEKGRRDFGITVSVSNFVPKPHTPFQWVRGNSEEALREKMYFLKDRLRKVKGVSFKFHDTRSSSVEMFLSKGDRRTFDVLVRAWEMGCRFDGWHEYFDYEKWVRAMDEAGTEIVLAAEKISDSLSDHEPDAGSGFAAVASMYTDTDDALPWEIVDEGTDKSLLIREYLRAVEENKAQSAGGDAS